jgi:hypothetical protein
MRIGDSSQKTYDIDIYQVYRDHNEMIILPAILWNRLFLYRYIT